MKETIKCIIIDDEELARTLLVNYISKLSNLEVVGLYSSPIDAFEMMKNEVVDIIFLDIQMPGMTGIEFLNSLTTRPLVIITTAYKEYAVQGFDLDVVDYLLKPFRFERFFKAINKSMRILDSSTRSRDENRRTTRQQNNKNYILVKSEFKTYKLDFDDILYMESMSEYVAYYTEEKRILSLGSLKKLETALPSDGFVRIHKSFIVNISYISVFEGNIVHVKDKRLPIGGMYKKDFISKIS